jgi:hypothetical protein
MNTPQITEFRIPWSTIKAVSLFSSKDETRYVLKGVRIEVKNGRVVAVATDGRRLLCIKADVEFDKPYEGEANFTIPLEIIERVRPTSRIEFNTVIRFNGDTRMIRVTDAVDGMAISKKAIEGNYPNWRQVIPKGEYKPGCSGQFNPHFFIPFQKASDYFDRKPMVQIFQSVRSPELEPLIIQNGNKDFFGVLMPVHSENKKLHRPDWL